MLIAQSEEVDMLTVVIGALLHDIADAKFHDGDESLAPKKAREFLMSKNVDKAFIQHIELIISNISFKNSLGKKQRFFSQELAVIRDADRLDAIGAIGIARTFNYGGYKNRVIYDPTLPPKLNQSKEAYKKSTAPTLNHFYEKLLLLKDNMHTETGRKIAEKRHAFMEVFLEQFYKEWDGVL
jgi:uncharacterized protein